MPLFPINHYINTEEGNAALEVLNYIYYIQYNLILNENDNNHVH